MADCTDGVINGVMASAARRSAQRWGAPPPARALPAELSFTDSRPEASRRRGRASRLAPLGASAARATREVAMRAVARAAARSLGARAARRRRRPRRRHEGDWKAAATRRRGGGDGSAAAAMKATVATAITAARAGDHGEAVAGPVRAARGGVSGGGHGGGDEGGGGGDSDEGGAASGAELRGGGSARVALDTTGVGIMRMPHRQHGAVHAERQRRAASGGCVRMNGPTHTRLDGGPRGAQAVWHMAGPAGASASARGWWCVAEANARLATRGSARVERVPKALARPDPEHAALPCPRPRVWVGWRKRGSIGGDGWSRCSFDAV